MRARTLLQFRWLALFLITGPAIAQPDAGRQKLANDNLVCLDRCDAGFAQCLGPVRPDGPSTPIPDRRGGTVPTPPPYEQCLLDRDICVAECQTLFARDRKRIAPPPPR